MQPRLVAYATKAGRKSKTLLLLAYATKAGRKSKTLLLLAYATKEELHEPISLFSTICLCSRAKKTAAKGLEKFQKKNPNLQLVIIAGRTLANTWWGKAWNQNLESYADYSNRMPRGRSYLRNGAVAGLEIETGEIQSLVFGSDKDPYHVSIRISPLKGDAWKKIILDCGGKLHSLQELISGKFPTELADLFTSKGGGLFPSPKEIKFSCDCPDSASLCKHIAAVLYGVGVKLDADPALFFTLRGVNIDELVSKSINQKSEKLLEKAKQKTKRVISDSDISDLFGVDLN